MNTRTPRLEILHLECRSILCEFERHELPARQLMFFCKNIRSDESLALLLHLGFLIFRSYQSDVPIRDDVALLA